jgi:hypothetical protein
VVMILSKPLQTVKRIKKPSRTLFCGLNKTKTTGIHLTGSFL